MMLRDYKLGDREALDEIVGVLYKDLKRVASGQLRQGGAGKTMTPTGLVHEFYLKIMGQQHLNATDRGHFLAISARAMRQVMADAARRKSAAKRGGGEANVTLDDDIALAMDDAKWLEELDDALTQLAEVNDRLAQVVECRFFGGLTEQETADALDSSLRTVQRDWKRARAWLKEELGVAPSVDNQ
jgi:RNA polymerase sigma factor (TIGR02999 family)